MASSSLGLVREITTFTPCNHFSPGKRYAFTLRDGIDSSATTVTMVSDPSRLFLEIDFHVYTSDGQVRCFKAKGNSFELPAAARVGGEGDLDHFHFFGKYADEATGPSFCLIFEAKKVKQLTLGDDSGSLPVILGNGKVLKISPHPAIQNRVRDCSEV